MIYWSGTCGEDVKGAALMRKDREKCRSFVYG